MSDIDEHEQNPLLRRLRQFLCIILIMSGLNLTYYAHVYFKLPNETLIEWIRDLLLIVTICSLLSLYRRLEQERSALGLMALLFRHVHPGAGCLSERHLLSGLGVSFVHAAGCGGLYRGCTRTE